MATVIVVSSELSAELMFPIATDGHRVIELERCGDAVRQIMEQRPDAVIVPDDAQSALGLEVLLTVGRMKEVAMVVVGAGDSDRMAHALFEGADAYIQHPINRAELRSRLRALLRRRTPTAPKERGTTELTRQIVA